MSVRFLFVKNRLYVNIYMIYELEIPPKDSIKGAQQSDPNTTQSYH